MHFRRTATQDTELRGSTIRAGDKVVVWYVSADFDADQFADPYSLRRRARPNDHVAFGLHSPHLCLGAHLARLEMRVLFEELLPMLDAVRSSAPPSGFARTSSRGSSGSTSRRLALAALRVGVRRRAPFAGRARRPARARG